MSYPPLPSNGETQWGDKFRTWADAIEGGKAEGSGLTLRRDTSVGTRVFLDHPDGSTMLYGDTGWRNVSELLENGWTGTLHIRRQNSNVFIRVLGLYGTAATSDLVYTLPQGMIDGLWRTVHFYDSVKDKTLVLSLYPNELRLPVRPEGYFPGGYLEIHVARLNPVTAWPNTALGTPV